MKSAFLPALIILQLLAGESSFADNPSHDTNHPPSLDYVILVTGGELLEGMYPDGHTHFITRALRPLGGRCVGCILVDDRREDMLKALRFAAQQAPMVIVTGGLGPTPNDITREVLSEFTGIALAENPEALAEMEKRFRRKRSDLASNLVRQTMTPQQGSYLKNPNGTAVGLVYQSDRQVVIALPGPPRELQAMVTQELVPLLQRRYGARLLGASLTLRFVGLGQSAIDQAIKEHLQMPPGLIITSFFEGSRVDFTFTMPGHSEADRSQLQSLEKQLTQHLGEYIYADNGDSLETVVLDKLRQKISSLVLVEMGSGGHLALALRANAGQDSFIRGAYLASTESQMRHLLHMANSPAPLEEISSQDRVIRMAKAAIQEASNQWAIVVGPIEYDDKKTPSVWIANGPVGPDWMTHRLILRDSGEIARSHLATQVLDHLRRSLNN